MNRKTVTYTSTLPNVVMEEVAEYAKKKKISKNKVIEMALKKLLDEEIKNDLRESFKKIEGETQLVEMAEWGMHDYAGQLKKFNK